MKTTLLKIAFVASIYFFKVPATYSQIMPDKAYWVVETNIQQKSYSIIRFYNQEHQLLYEEKLAGKYLDVTKKQDKKFLNKALQYYLNNAGTLAAIREGKLIASRF